MADVERSTAAGNSGSEEWTPEFPGQRPPFEEGNAVALRHGAYSVLRLTPRAGEVSDALVVLAEQEGIYRPIFGPAYALAGEVGARLEAAFTALAETEDAGDLARLERDARGWANSYLSILRDLGFTPLALGKLALDVALGKEAAKRALADHLAAKGGGGK